MPVFSAFAGNKLANMPKATAATAALIHPGQRMALSCFSLKNTI
jgi:hypothetical protein